MAGLASDWEKITPEEVRPPVKHIRDSFNTAVWKCSEVTKAWGYAALHPEWPGPSSFAPAFLMYKAIVGPRALRQFEELCRIHTPPALFKAYFDLFFRGIEVQIPHEFDQLLRIGTANFDALRTHPVDWAQSHMCFLIKGNAYRVKIWIKEVCDQQSRLIKVETNEEIEESIHWKTWRAPKLVHMQPSGNTPYDVAVAWTREDEPRTLELLEALTGRFVQFLGFGLDKIVGDAHVRLAASKEHSAFYTSKLKQRQPRSYVTNTAEPSERLEGEWNSIEISFLSDERVQIRNGTQSETCNYAELGFMDRRNEKPNSAWLVLRELAEHHGVIRNPSEAGCAWTKVEKRIQNIRSVFRAYFGIAADPIPFVPGTGYQALFKISCRRSFNT